MSWQIEALCRGADVNMFYSKGVVSREAVQMCEQCPVLEECYENALYNEAFGYQGGSTEKERYLERKRLGIKEPEKNDDVRRTIQRRKKKDFHPNDVSHGTEKGYQQERNHLLPTCSKCLKAHREYINAHRRKNLVA